MPWDAAKALSVYRSVFPDDSIFPGTGDPREMDIVAEMNAVKTAPTVDAAAEVIEWWGWDNEMTAVDAAKRIRRFKV